MRKPAREQTKVSGFSDFGPVRTRWTKVDQVADLEDAPSFIVVFLPDQMLLLHSHFCRNPFIMVV